MAIFAEGVSYRTIACYQCGMHFAMTADFYDRRVDDHASFFCPSGHRQHFIGQSEAQKLKAQLDRKETELANARDRANRFQAERDAAAKAHRKMRARVANGVCPCCNRSFENLRNHMQSQHPEYGEQQTLYALRTAFGMTQAQVAEEAGLRNQTYVSAYERGRPVPVSAKEALDFWIERQGAAA